MSTMTAPRWDDLEVGQEIPPLVKTPTPMQLFMFSASSWNRHLIHYNTEFAHKDGLKHVAVHRALLGGFLAQMLTEWLQDAGDLEMLDWSVRGSAAIHEPLTCKGKIIGKRAEGDRRLVDCDVWIDSHEGATIVPGSARVRLLS